MACGSESQLDRNVDFPCDSPPGPGLESDIYIGYKSDLTGGILRKGVKGPDSKVVTALGLKADAKLRKIKGFKLSNNFTNGFTQSNFGNKKPHNFQFIIFDQREIGLYAADELSDTDGIFIVSRDNDTDGEFRVHGLRTGMTCTNLTTDKNNTETGGAITLDFSAPNERKLPDILRIIDGAANKTREYLEALLIEEPA